MDKKKSPDKKDSQLRKKAEAKLQKGQEERDELSLSELEHELSVHEIELEMQNEELHIAQSKLTATLNEFSVLFEQSPVCYFILDKNGIIQLLNKRACSQLQIDRSKAIGKPFSMFLHGEMEQDHFYRHRMAVMEQEDLQSVSCEIKRPDGSVFSVKINSSIVKDENNAFKHFLLIVTDISAIIEHERQVEIALKKANELNEMKSRFISLASHEFRTPLTSVLSSVWLINQYLMTSNKEEIHTHLNKIRGSVKHLTLILDEFLSHDKLETGSVKISKEKINLPRFFEGLVSDIKISLKHNDFIRYSHMGKLEIDSDKKILYHIVTNLLSNAVKYSGKNVQVNFSSRVNNDRLTITIADNGIGIPPEEQPYIFNRFFRAKNALTRQGTGLGLNIVQEYLKLLNGTILFESKPGMGTTFIVEIPVAKQASSARMVKEAD